MTVDYGLPDLFPAFHMRLQRLLDALGGALVLDRDILLVIPHCSDSNEHQQWIAQMARERANRPHLTTYWQAVNPNPAQRAPPVPWTVGVALDLVAEGLDDLAAELAAEVLFCLERTVEKKFAPAVLARSVVQQWPRPRMETGAAAFALQALTAALRSLPEDEHPPSHHLAGYNDDDMPVVFYYWPAKAAPADVATWARKGLNVGGSGDTLFAEAARGTMPSDVLLPYNGKLYRIPFAGLAVLYLAERDVREKLGRPTAAVSAAKVHHEVMTGMGAMPNTLRRPRDEHEPLDLPVKRSGGGGGTIFLTGPGASGMQLALPFDGEVPHEGVVLRLREMHGAQGAKYIRHWAALNVLWSIQGARQGWVRWTLDEHLDVLGYKADTRQDPVKRAEVAAEVEQLTRLELVRLDESGTRRYEAPLIHVGARERERDGSGWRLDGMILRANELVYGGVRDADSGQLGRNWIGVPADLAKVDHVRHPYAHALGLVIPMRARWRIGEEEEARRRQLTLNSDRSALVPEYPEGIVEMSGDKLLKWFVPHSTRTPRAMGGMRRDIEALVDIEVFDPVEWRGEPWSLAGIIRFRLTPWLLDRAVRGLLPVERAPVETPLTGGALTAWRKTRGWSQREAARQLGVGQASLSRAEAVPAATLPPALRAAFTALLTR